MFERVRERYRPKQVSAIESIIRDIDAVHDDNDDYLTRARDYLGWALRCGLTSKPVADSCIDLAETLTSIHEVDEVRQQKSANWQIVRAEALAIAREPRIINMELDPVYFEAILKGTKTFEGRAYKPDSDKNYPDIRQGDIIRFTLSERRDEFTEDAMNRGLHPNDVMVCEVNDIHFAPTVHGMYQNFRFDGDAFQPMINGPSEIIQLQRAAVYHTFPNYHEQIAKHGFLGIQLRNPQLAQSTVR